MPPTSVPISRGRFLQTLILLAAAPVCAQADPGAGSIVALAQQFVGGRYVWGGSSPASGGFDCSGLVQYVFGRHGIRLPRVAEDQFQVGAPIAFRDLRPGDLIFLKNTYKLGISHVGIYIGDGKMLHARGRDWGIRIDPIGPGGNYAGARRVLGGAALVRPTPPSSPPRPIAAVAFQELPAGPVSGTVRLAVGYDPQPHGPGVEYAIEIDGEEAVAFPEAGVFVRFDTVQLADGEHVMKLVRQNRSTGARFIAQTVAIVTENFQ